MLALTQEGTFCFAFACVQDPVAVLFALARVQESHERAIYEQELKEAKAAAVSSVMCALKICFVCAFACAGGPRACDLRAGAEGEGGQGCSGEWLDFCCCLLLLLLLRAVVQTCEQWQLTKAAAVSGQLIACVVCTTQLCADM